MTSAPTLALGLATFLCSLTAGFLFAFAVVVMPGLQGLNDAAYLRAFQVIDGVIQSNQPLFGLVWVGSIVAMLAAVVIGVPALSGTPRTLLVAAALLYFGGVQAPTVTVNIPLNNEVQELDIPTLDVDAAADARARFEPRWHRWNAIRTLVATATVALLLLAFGATSRQSAERPAPSDRAVEGVDQRIEGQMAAEDTPGAILGVASEGRLLHLRADGPGSVERDVPRNRLV
jgi:uncharacterized membrane protein